MPASPSQDPSAARLSAGLGSQRRRVGRSSCEISALGLGTAALATVYGAPGGERSAPDELVAMRTVDRALQAGITFIDTAPAYGNAEAIVGRACAGADCQIATKIAIPPAGWERLSSVEAVDHIRHSLERSLDRLGRSRVELLQIHNADAGLIARGEIVAELEALRGEGLVLACGATVYGERNALAAIACPTFDSVQIAYSALDRRPERMLVSAAAQASTSLIARSLLLRGVLSPAGRDLRGRFAPLSNAADGFRTAAGVSWEELPAAAVAFALTRTGITCSVVGPRDELELEQLLSGAAYFAGAIGQLAGDWDRGLTEDLLDPSRW
jgi:aryl-alcohol dehydrogenase-like predicted oxidoreductase